MRNRTLIAAPLVLVALALASCGTGGTPVAESTGSEPGSSAAPSFQGSTSAQPTSQITDPLDTTKLEANICSGMTDDQLAQYIGAVRKKDTLSGVNGPGCNFLPVDDNNPTVALSVQDIAAPTEASLYDSLQQFPWRQKIDPILGYPAVDTSPRSNGAASGQCETTVAVNDSHTVMAQFSAITTQNSPYYAKACSASEALAKQLVQNLKSGGA